MLLKKDLPRQVNDQEVTILLSDYFSVKNFDNFLNQFSRHMETAICINIGLLTKKKHQKPTNKM